MRGKWINIGTISVDAGLCWIGDPCYILHQDNPLNSIGRCWSEFCDVIQKSFTKDKPAVEFNHNGGYNGAGVCVSTGYGDGCYEVQALIDNGIVKSIKIDFADDNDDE